MRQYEVRAGLLGGAIAGALDITDPIVFSGLRGVAPVRIEGDRACGGAAESGHSGLTSPPGNRQHSPALGVTVASDCPLVSAPG